MSLLRPSFPPLDHATWTTAARSERIRPAVEHYVRHGFGAPTIMPLLYGVKIVAYVVGAALFASTTSGSGGLSAIGDWWADPITFQKVVFFTILFEVLGLGCGFGPLNSRVWPPMGSPLYWLRPGTIRLPPWPGRVPLTRGDSRTVVDVALYASGLVLLVIGLVSDGVRRGDTLLLPVWNVVAMLAVFGLLGLRDKVVFMACRGEVYLSIAVMFLFLAPDVIVGAKLIMLLIWMGAATSKLNRHFPFVISAMLANSPVVRPTSLKPRLFKDPPRDVRPSGAAAAIAHFSTVVEFGVPLVLVTTHSGPVLYVAAAIMVIFHLGIITAVPMGVPLEWNVFMIYGMLALFVANSDVSFSDLQNPGPVFAVFAVMLAIVVIGAVAPRKVNFLFGMRYYAGNWDTTLWLMTPAAREKLENSITCIPPIPAHLAHHMHGDAGPEVPLYVGYAFRAMNTHGRALFTLAHRAIDPERADEYVITDGEVITSLVVGWNFGDGHFADERMVRALQRRAHFEPGEVRIVMLDAQAIHRQVQHYRIVDAATGVIERGTASVAEMAARQPWDDTVPVQVAADRA